MSKDPFHDKSIEDDEWFIEILEHCKKYEDPKRPREAGVRYHIPEVVRMTLDRLECQLHYEGVLPQIVEVAKSCGYAIGLHGSLRRDCDLIAVPWVADHKTPAELAEAIRVAVGGVFTNTKTPMPEQKPCGRLGWSINIDTHRAWYFDLSVMPG